MTNQEIKDYIAKMVPEGHSLSQIQDILKKEGVNITFMELRLLASELETEVWQKEDAKKEEERRKADKAAALAGSHNTPSPASPEQPYPGNDPARMAPGMGRGMGRLPEEDMEEDAAYPPQQESAASMPPPVQEEAAEEAQQQVSGGTQVELSPIARPGAVASGTVKFGSGVTADWVLDRTGRIGLDNPTGSPTQQDIQEFQMELQKLFAR